MNYAIILAGGKSYRFNSKSNIRGNKLLQKINNKAVWQHSLDLIVSHKLIDQVIVVCGNEINKYIKCSGVLHTASAGETRYKSLINGLNIFKKNLKNDDIIVIHNAANPLATKKEISRVIRGAKKSGAASVGSKIIDTIKEVGQNKRILRTLDRNSLFAMQTPQAIRSDILLAGISRIKKEPTDDLMIAEAAGIKPTLVIKSKNNFKITTQQDLVLAKYLSKDLPEEFICGIGQDSHKFLKNEKGLVLGGVKFMDYPKLKANSDGDVIIHAIVNAISSSIGQGSLSLFADEMCKNGVRDSKKYLEFILEKIEQMDFQINNISISLECAVPAIEPISSKIKSSLASLTDISVEKIGITATSGEKLSSYGKGEGIKCTAIISLVK